ncbi:TPA: Rib/alpha-like domain-containing protein, partial [Streptococcus suis]
VGVLPKSDRYQAQVTDSAQVLPTSTSEATKAEILKQISLPSDVGQVNLEVLGTLPQTSGDHTVTVRVVYDDLSQEEVLVPLHILFTEHGKGVKHSLPVGVLPKSDRYQAQVTGSTQVLPTSTSEATKAEILKQISLPTEAGPVDLEVLGTLPQSSGDYTMTVRVVYDDLSQEEVAVPLHILFVGNDKGVKHSLPAGVLPAIVSAKGSGVQHSLPAGVLPAIVSAKGSSVQHSLPAGVLPAIVSAKGSGVKHSLPVGVLPKSDRYQAQVTGSTQVLPTSTSEATKAEILKQISLPSDVGQVGLEVVSPILQSSGDYVVTVRVVYDDLSQEEVLVPLHILFTEHGKGVKHSLPAGVLPAIVSAKGSGVQHILPVGVLPPLVTAKGTGLTVELPEISLSQLEPAQIRPRPKLARQEVVPQKQREEQVSSLTSTVSSTSSPSRLPETGQIHNNLSIFGFLLASLGLGFWLDRKKAE